MGLDNMVQKTMDDFEDINSYNRPLITIGIQSNKMTNLPGAWAEILEEGKCAADPDIVNCLTSLYRGYMHDLGKRVPEDFSIPELSKEQLKTIYGQTNFIDNMFLHEGEVKFPRTVFVDKYKR